MNKTDKQDAKPKTGRCQDCERRIKISAAAPLPLCEECAQIYNMVGCPLV